MIHSMLEHGILVHRNVALHTTSCCLGVIENDRTVAKVAIGQLVDNLFIADYIVLYTHT